MGRQHGTAGSDRRCGCPCGSLKAKTAVFAVLDIHILVGGWVECQTPYMWRSTRDSPAIPFIRAPIDRNLIQGAMSGVSSPGGAHLGTNRPPRPVNVLTNENFGPPGR